MSSHGDGKGYMIPDEPSPVGDICIRVRVPNDVKYVAAFWGAYQYFTTWKAWQRDEAKTGKVCAERWKQSFDMARLEYEKELANMCNCGCGCGCGGGIVDYAPSPGQYPIERTTSNAAINVYREAMAGVLASKTGGVSVGEAVTEFLKRYPSANPKNAEDFIGKVYSNVPTPGIDDPDWNVVRNQVGCDIKVLTFEILDTLKSVVRVVFSELDASWMAMADIFEDFSNTELEAEIYLMSIYDDLPDFGEPDCSSVWSHTFDFTVEDGGFVAYSPGGVDRALWVSGSGWEDGVHGDSLIQIEQSIPPTYISDLTMTVVGPLTHVQLRCPDEVGAEYRESSPDAFNVRRVVSGLWLSVDNTFQGQVGVLVSVAVNGTGVNPFI